MKLRCSEPHHTHTKHGPQLDIPLHVIRDNGCELFEENGCPAAPDHDRRTDFHFNALLDAVAEWKLERLNLAKAKNVENRDSEKGENCNRLDFWFYYL